MEQNYVERQPWMKDDHFAWANKEEESRQNTLARREQLGGCAIVAIKAQHPLQPHGVPGPEYEQRLEKALEVGQQLRSHGLDADYVTVGGVHAGHPTMTLADAGRNWLLQHRVPSECIKSYGAVYSGNDEDLVITRLFESSIGYRELHIVLSAGQFERCRLMFMSYGWQPTLHPITFVDARPHHSAIYELWGEKGVPSLLGGAATINEATRAIRQQHLEEAIPQSPQT